MVAENVGVVRASETKTESEQACGLSVVLPCLNEVETSRPASQRRSSL